MAKVLSRNVPWLTRPSPGFTLFETDKQPQTPQRLEGPSCRLAHRGTEIFVAVGNELRWSDLSLLKAAHENEEHTQAYRVLKIPVARPIRQLSVSPSGDYLAIVTSHTCHVAILPSPTHLRSGDTSPLRLKAFQVGPTAHVLEQGPLRSLLWHPLSPSGNCLITVTQDACVRLWELDSNNRSTFDEPSLAIDLKKLANATSTQADFSASKYGTSNGFSPDSVEMEVAAACFGGNGAEDELGWANMTLWVAMSEGDVYALCPLLPSKWRAPSTLLPSLSTSVVAKQRATSADTEATESEKRKADQQCRWLAEIDAQDPIVLTASNDMEKGEVYSRPDRPGSVPKLQGPFYVSADIGSGDITDIHAVAPKVDEETIFEDDGEELDEEPGLSVGLVCLLTSRNKLFVCLDLNGVEAEWLPPKRAKAIIPDAEDDLELLVFETIDVAEDTKVEGWPTFTSSLLSRYELLVTTPCGVSSVEFTPWVGMLEDELSGASEAGIDVRLGALLASASTSAVHLIDLTTPSPEPLNAAVAVYDPVGIGHLVLTSTDNNALSAVLELPPQSAHPYAPDPTISAGAFLALNPRAPYQPDPAFYTKSALPQLIKSANDRRILGSDLKSQVRFSPATLQLMSEAHRILSSETHTLGLAAADLFRRCERMQAELVEQVRKVREMAAKMESVVSGADADEANEDHETEGQHLALTTTAQKIDHRIHATEDRTEELNARVDRLRRKMLRLGHGQPLSASEEAFAREIEILQSSLSLATPAEEGEDEDEEDQAAPTSPTALLHLANSPESLPSKSKHLRAQPSEDTATLASRLEAAKSMQERLTRQVQDLVQRHQRQGRVSEASAGNEEATSTTTTGPVGGEFRKRKLAQVAALLERETAMLEGVAGRLARLGVHGSG